MSGKSTDSRWRPMPAFSLVSFKHPRPSLAIFGRASGKIFEKNNINSGFSSFGLVTLVAESVAGLKAVL